MSVIDPISPIGPYERMGAIDPHLVFDALASLTAFTVTWLAHVLRLRGSYPVDVDRLGIGYPLALVAGAVIGGYGLGTLNLALTGIDGVGRSIVGALAGAIVAVELFKARRGIAGSTGIIFVPGFCATVAIGRIGCYLSGLDDQTHGIPTNLPWGHDFGDGIPRHPVQLYESATMALFLLIAARALYARKHWIYVYGFYVMIAVYAFQRFLWEFLKPYGTLAGPLNLFHFVCLALFSYALAMIGRRARV